MCEEWSRIIKLRNVWPQIMHYGDLSTSRSNSEDTCDNMYASILFLRKPRHTCYGSMIQPRPALEGSYRSSVLKGWSRVDKRKMRMYMYHV